MYDAFTIHFSLTGQSMPAPSIQVWSFVCEAQLYEPVSAVDPAGMK